MHLIRNSSGGPTSPVLQPAATIMSKATGSGHSRRSSSMSISRQLSLGPSTTSPKVTFADPVVSGHSSPPYSPPALSTYSRLSGSPLQSPCESSAEEKRPPAINEVDLPSGVVDMDAYSQILALDEDDADREFSKALVWAWCDQAELAIDEMDSALEHGDAAAAANKAQYLKGSSASLGMIKVAITCQSIHYLHFPASLAHYRSHCKFPSEGNFASFAQRDGSNENLDVPPMPSPSESRSSSSSSMSNSSSDSSTSTLLSSVRSSPPSSASVSPEPASDESKSLSRSSSLSASASPSRIMSGSNVHRFSAALAGLKSAAPAIPSMPTDFEANKIIRAKELVTRLKAEITEASEWLYSFYQGADRYAASMAVDAE